MIKESLYTSTADSVMDQLSSRRTGLTNEEAQGIRLRSGYNEAPGPRKGPLTRQVVSALCEPMVLVLLAAALFSQLIGDWVEALAILGVVVINTVVTLVLKAQARKSLDTLAKMLAPTVRVLRQGTIEILSTRFLVPGDIILLEAGDVIPADARVLDSKNFTVDESSLTGEAEGVKKNSKPQPGHRLGPRELRNLVFCGSKVVEGTALAVVFAVGSQTLQGQTPPPQESSVETDLRSKLARETNLLVVLAFLSAAAVLIIFLCKNLNTWDARIIENAILLAVTIMVAVFPEGLPASVTIALSLAVERLARKSVIVKRLETVEALGSIDTICTDKIGALTAPRMGVEGFYLDLKFQTKADLFKLSAERSALDLRDLFLIISKNPTAAIEEKDGTVLTESGDPVGAALLKVALFSGFKPGEFDAPIEVIDALPHTSQRAFGASLVREPSGRRLVLIQGTVEKTMALSSTCRTSWGEIALDQSLRRQIEADLDERKTAGYQLVGFALGEPGPDEKKLRTEALPALTWMGAAVIAESPKMALRQAVQEAEEAGIRVLLVTGEGRKAAWAAAEAAVIASEPRQCQDGRDLDQLSPQEFRRTVEDTRVFSRVGPLEKLKIVKTLRHNGHAVAQTGDGVQDAPVLRAAHLGLAMGRSGARVSQEAADVILTDDQFSTIVTAVREGRTVLANLKKLVQFLVTNNIGKVVATILTPLFVPGAALNAIMLLWASIFMETAPGVSLSLDAGTRHHPAPRPGEPLFPRKDRLLMFFDGLFFGLAITAGYLVTWHWALVQGLSVDTASGLAQTAAFAVSLLSPQLYIFALRDGIFLGKITAPNPWLKAFSLLMVLMVPLTVFVPFCQQIFHTQAITSAKLWAVILGLAVFTPAFRLVRDRFSGSNKPSVPPRSP